MRLIRLFLFLSVVLGVSSCAVVQSGLGKSVLKKNLTKSPFFNSHFTGFVLYDPETEENLFSWNEEKYFNLASNTKLLTLYASLQLLGDSIPGLLYQIEDDTLYFQPTGDPTFLHPVAKRQRALELLSDTSKSLAFVPVTFDDNKQAPGWTWEDYQYYYQPERTSFPIYANSVSFLYDTLEDKFEVYPKFFEDFVEILEEPEPIPQRSRTANIFAFHPDTARSNYKNRVPFLTSDELTIHLLEDTLHKDISVRPRFNFDDPDTLFSVPAYDLYAFMLKVSDNLTAEHLLYLCAFNSGWEINSSIVRRHILNQNFSGHDNTPIWRDGSGLSRYNLATPSFMIELMKKINHEIPLRTMKQMFSVGGSDGTLRNYYKPKPGEQPYIFGKTGTLSNNHNLTGIIETSSGRQLFFSFMNNNYPSGSRTVKKEMEKVMRVIYEKY